LDGGWGWWYILYNATIECMQILHQLQVVFTFRMILIWPATLLHLTNIGLSYIVILTPP